MEDDHIDLSEHETHSEGPGTRPVQTPNEYGKFFGIIFAVFIVAVALTLVRGWTLRLFVSDFLAVFFITFAGFKFIHIEPFAITYRAYDLVARRFRPWPYIVPFIEAVFGFFFLLMDKSAGLYVLALIYGVASTVGPWTEVRKADSASPRLGNYIKLPLSIITLAQNATVSVMALLLLFL